MNRTERAVRRTAAQARDARTRVVTGKGAEHRDRETGERIQDTGAYIGVGNALTFNFSNPMEARDG